MTAEEAAWMAWRDDPRPLGWFIPRDERAFKDGYRAARAEAFAEIRDRVRRMPTVKVPRADFEWSGETVRAVDIAAVLALLPAVPPEKK